MGYGIGSFAAISFQSSYGTLNTNSLDYFPIISESLTNEVEDLIQEGLMGRFEEGASYQGMNSVKGDLVMEVHPILVGKLLKAWCGQSSSTLVGSVTTHSFVPRQVDWDAMAAVPPMTIEIYRSVNVGSSFLYYDLCCDALTLEVANGEFWKATMGIVGGKFQKINKSTPVYKTGKLFTWDVTSISLGGGAVDEYSRMTFKGSNALVAKGTLDGTRFANRVKRNGYRSMEVSGVLMYDDQVEYDKFTARTQQRAIVTARGDSITTSQNNLLKVDVPQLLYTAFPINVGGPGLIEANFTGKAKFDETSSYMTEFTLINTQTAY
jgi:Phage tail tube protein